MKFPKLESEGKGYISKSFSNYPLLLLIYVGGILSLRNRNYELLKIILEKEVNVQLGYNMIKSELKFIEIYNPYHLFNEADGFIVPLYSYLLPEGSENKNKPWLIAMKEFKLT